jgi:hypothetical protein
MYSGTCHDLWKPWKDSASYNLCCQKGTWRYSCFGTLPYETSFGTLLAVAILASARLDG